MSIVFTITTSLRRQKPPHCNKLQYTIDIVYTANMIVTYIPKPTAVKVSTNFYY